MKKTFLFLLLSSLTLFTAKAQWAKQALPVGPGAYFNATTANNISAVDQNVVWASSGNSIYRTIDGGNTWNEVTPVLNDPQFVVSQINSIYAQDASTAYLLAEVYKSHYFLNRVYKTTDGGQTWIRQAEAYPNQSTYGLSQSCLIHFFNANN